MVEPFYVVELHPALSIILKQMPESPLKSSFKTRVESFLRERSPLSRLD